MRIAVVGAGISGLTAAYYLSRVHEVDLFDKDRHAGGHARTICVDRGAGEVGLDIGFMVYNEASYVGFSDLLRELGVRTQPSDMSFGVSCAGCKVEYSSRGTAGMLAGRDSLFRPAMLRLGLDIIRFYSDAPRSTNDAALATATIDEYLRRKRFGDGFRRHFIVPLLAAVWSTPPAMVGGFPAQYFLRFIRNHGLVGGRAFAWRTVSGGSARYVERLLGASRFHTLLGVAVTGISRCATGVAVRMASGESREFDKVVLACHSDQALSLLEDAGEAETAALRRITYQPNRVVLHTDDSFLPSTPAARASWNYVTRDCRDGAAPLSLTYHLNRLHSIAGREDYCVTVNPGREIPPSRVIHESEMAHPRYTFETLAGQTALGQLQGQRHTYYAGAYLGYGFHEDGFASGREAARALGAPV